MAKTFQLQAILLVCLVVGLNSSALAQNSDGLPFPQQQGSWSGPAGTPEPTVEVVKQKVVPTNGANWGPAIAYSAFARPLSAVPPMSRTSRRGCLICGQSAGLPNPIGASVNTISEVQANNARAEYFVIYPHEWTNDQADLKPAGQAHLKWITTHLSSTYSKVRVVPTGVAQIDQAHLATIAGVLRNNNIPDVEVRVELAPPYAEGLRFDEIEYVGYSALTGFGGFGNGGWGGGGGGWGGGGWGRGSFGGWGGGGGGWGGGSWGGGWGGW